MSALQTLEKLRTDHPLLIQVQDMIYKIVTVLYDNNRWLLCSTNFTVRKTECANSFTQMYTDINIIYT